MTEARLKAAILREVRRLGNKRLDRGDYPQIAAIAYHDGWIDACQQLESALMEMFGKKEKG